MPFTVPALEGLTADLPRDLRAFLPETIVAVGVVVLLLLRLWPRTARGHRGGAALIFCAGGLGVALGQWQTGAAAPDAFGGLLVSDTFSVFLRILLLLGAGLTALLTLLTGWPERDDSADFYVLLLGATLGMMLMASANHLLMAYLAVEMASVPSYALAGFRKGSRFSSEAALKYVVYGGSASGVMLYGISLLCGQFGTGYLPDLAAGLAAAPPGPAVLLALLLVTVGLGFKLAVVPYHFWCPDVFEGAAAEVAGFLSVVSKGAALALTARLVFAVAGSSATDFAVPLLALLSALSMTAGNLAAFRQTNLKRLLAYSTIAHAGTMLMGLAAGTRAGAAAVLFYLVAYLAANLGAFAVVAFVRSRTGAEDLAGLRGLVFRSPALAVTLTVFLLSLLGLPPLAGFAAKFQVFAAVAQAADAAHSDPTRSWTLYALAAVGLANTLFGAVYYLNVVRVLILDRPDTDTALSPPRGAAAFAAVLAVLTVVPGVAWGPLVDAAGRAVP
jgi:NADH-quinone oxidoreductase subunit N